MTLAFTLLCTTAFGQSVALPDEAPIPSLRPFLPTGIASPHAASAFGHLLDKPSENARLREGIAAIGARDIGKARQVRDSFEAGALPRKILTWSIARLGDPGVSSKEIADAILELNGWPGLARLLAAREKALYREKPAPQDVIAAFANASPTTFEGTVLLGSAWLATGERQAAYALMSRLWRERVLTEAQERLVLDRFGDLLSDDDHRFRLERMLLAERTDSAKRVARLLKAEKLTEAWEAVSRNAANAAALTDAVPEDQRSATWHFLKSRQLRRAGNFNEAARIMLAVDPEETAAVDPDAWWVERRVLSRELLDIKQEELAYEVAASQVGGSPVSQADAAFHAGWYALRFMDDSVRAVAQFQRIVEVADGPISLARAHYWMGRAADAGAPGVDATEHYALAAQHGTTFYGQLATAKLGQTTLAHATTTSDLAMNLQFAAMEPVQAIRLLEEHGFNDSASVLYRDLAQTITSVEELTQLVRMAEKQGKHYLALRLVKASAARGLAVSGLTHPVGAIPASTSLSGAGQALAYAIARQESEFNVAAVSGAGALGLLQLMPGTAREMARKSGLPYSARRLTSDPAYNATLGTAYLDDQLARFGGSYILTFIGYNAGPRRASRWIERYGDPRGRPIEEVVDWIERIPFTETRAYVQRVLENYQVYKMQITGHFDIEKDLINGR